MPNLIRKLPSVWDETKFIDGYPGKFVVIARRNAATWNVAAVSGENVDKQTTINLPMLAGQDVKLIYDNNDRTTGFKIFKVKKDGTVKLNLLSEGGAIIQSLKCQKSISLFNVIFILQPLGTTFCSDRG
ncbi:MAG: glycoside hydrolase family 97 C-terminal domain-containing protein [Prolixibacteraceae bacterium]|nr:glycoside hydrolase family 97 C-terminal domain-containing protein [Prolixibacteraceae bacterium]